MSSTSGVGRPKPWERQVPPEVTSSPGAESAAKPWEVPRVGSHATVETIVPESTAGPVQQPGSRPWENRGALSTTYGSGLGYGSTAGGSMYGSGLGYGSTAGGSMYGSGLGYGSTAGGMYGSGFGYGSTVGGSMYGYGGGMYGARPMFGGTGPMFGGTGPMFGGVGPVVDGTSSPWQTMLGGIGSMVHFFGRLSFLVDENAHAVHFFISALLQLLDRFGSLYGELARFILRLLGFRRDDPGKEKHQEDPTKRVGHMTTFDRTWNDSK